MKKLLLILFILPCLLFGQGWEKTFGDADWGRSVQQTTDGGYIVAGATDFFDNESSDVYLIKIDENGNEQWNQTFGGGDDDYGISVQQTTDDGYIITGGTRSFGNGNTDVYLIKTDENGSEQWTQTFGGNKYDYATSVQQTSDGGYIIIGYTYSFATNDNFGDAYLIKTDGNGNEQWNQTFGGTNDDGGYSVQQTSDGGYIITGYTYSFGNGNSDVYLIKTDGNGSEQWNQTFGGADYDYGFSVQQTTDDGYIITGQTAYFDTNNNIIGDVYLIKTDGNGNEQWNQTFGGTNDDRGFSVQQTTDAGYIITGYTYSFGNGNSDVYLIKTDGNGVEQWNQTFGGIDDDEASSVQQTTDGGYIITGYTQSFTSTGNYSEIYLIKTDANGIVSNEEIISLPSNKTLTKIVDVLGRETKYTKNQILFYIYDDGTVEKRFEFK